MKRVLAVAALVLAFAGTAFARGSNKPIEQQTVTDSDSLGAAADTSAVFKIPGETETFFTTVWFDSIAVYKTQVSPDYGSAGTAAKWMTIDTDTTAASVPESTADFGKLYADWWGRIIIDSAAAATKFRGQSYFQWRD